LGCILRCFLRCIWGCKRGRFPPVFSPGLVILRRETELVEGKDPVTLCYAGSSATPSPKGSALKNLDAFCWRQQNFFFKVANCDHKDFECLEVANCDFQFFLHKFHFSFQVFFHHLICRLMSQYNLPFFHQIFRRIKLFLNYLEIPDSWRKILF